MALLLEVVIAVFGGLYLLIKLLKKKTPNNGFVSVSKPVVDTQQELRDWTRKVVDENAEREISDFVYNHDNYYKMLEQVKDVYDEILAKYPLESFWRPASWPKPPKDCGHKSFAEACMRANRNNAKRILLAKRGLIPSFETRYVTATGKKPLVGNMHLTPPEIMVERWCAKELERHGFAGKFASTTIVENDGGFPNGVLGVQGGFWVANPIRWNEYWAEWGRRSSTSFGHNFGLAQF